MAPFLGRGAGNVDRQCAQHTYTSSEPNLTYILLGNFPPNQSFCTLVKIALGHCVHKCFLLSPSSIASPAQDLD